MSRNLLRVLYVDDETVLLDLAKMFLERTLEFSVDVTESAVDALEILSRKKFDAIVSDYQMPVMNGIEFLIHVREKLGNIPFILFTGKGREEVVIKAIDSGVDFYLQKGGDAKSQFAELAHKIKKSVEQNIAIKTLEENENRMRLILDGAKEGHWDVNFQSGEIYISPRVWEMLGYLHEEMHKIRKFNWKTLVHPDEIQMAEEKLQEYYSGKHDFFSMELRLSTKNGGWKWAFVRGKVVEYDNDNNPVRFVGTVTDISEQKKAEAELQLVKKDWEAIFRAIGNPICILDPKHTIIDANDAVLSLTGRPLNEIIGLKCWNLFHDPKASSFAPGCPMETMKKSGRTESAVMKVEAMDRIFIVSCTPVFNDDGNIARIIHISTDITENQKLEQDLKENRDYLDQIFSSVKEGIVIVDANTHEILDVNPAAALMIGAKKEEIIHQVCHNFICPNEKGKCPITDLNEADDDAERELCTVNGNRIPIIKYVVPFTHKGRECLLETFIDNSERKKTLDELIAAYERIKESEEELRAQYQELTVLKNSLEDNERKLRAIIETTPDVIWDLSPDGTFTYLSPQSYDILGYRPEEKIGSKLVDLVKPEHREEVIEVIKKGMLGRTGLLTFDIPCIHKDGREIILNIRSSPLIDDDNNIIGFRGVSQDVTEKEKILSDLREQKYQSELLIEQKDIFLNQLAHDLRTPLTPIIGMGPLLLQGITDPDARELVEIFLKSVEYLHKLAEDILMYADLNRTWILDSFENYDMSDLISDAIDANLYLAEQKEVFIENAALPGIMARVSKPYARVVFRNLINNAVKYSPPKGKVSIKVYLSGQNIVVSISDEGIGIPPESIDKIWNELFIGSSSRMDPFSKGFGLPIVKKIVELHDGRIEAFSEGSMKGATFTVYLPRTDKDT